MGERDLPTRLRPRHEDNCGDTCRNAGPTTWVDLNHDCCGFCNDLYDYAETQPEIVAWQTERAARPAVTTDRDALSDEVASYSRGIR